jgi:phosphoribosylformylglycinamidine cyclo-ligase
MPAGRRLKRRRPKAPRRVAGQRLTYKLSGVSIAAGDAAVRKIVPLAASTARDEVIGGIGKFASFVRLPGGYSSPVLVSSTDGVGSKLKVAFMADRHDSVGIDLVAMGVNDIIVHGAEPLYFLDYIGTARVQPDRIAEIVSGIARGCRIARCALVGGETAELPDLYGPDEYDLAGFAVGIAEESRLIDGRRVSGGDVIVGLPSSGLHSNGYSLARRIVFKELRLKIDSVFPETSESVADALLTPTRIYVDPVLKVRDRVHAMAHITGGGLTGNVPRVLPEGCRAVIERKAWHVPPVLRVLCERGRLSTSEMFRTFNMGIGYVLIVGKTAVDEVVSALAGAHEDPRVIGEVVAGDRGVELA